MANLLERGLVLRGFVLALSVGLAEGCGDGRATPTTSQPASTAEAQARLLYQKCRRSSGLDIAARRDAAAKLARVKAGEPWVVLLLLQEDAFDPLAEGSPPDEMIRKLREFDQAVTAAMLENLPADAGSATLHAVSCRLSDSREGCYSQVSGTFLVQCIEDCQTKPIKDIARQALVRILKVDHGYDMQKWRTAIEAR